MKKLHIYYKYKKIYISENNNQNNYQQLICVSKQNNEIHEKKPIKNNWNSFRHIFHSQW